MSEVSVLVVRIEAPGIVSQAKANDLLRVLGTVAKSYSWSVESHQFTPATEENPQVFQSKLEKSDSFRSKRDWSRTSNSGLFQSKREK